MANLIASGIQKEFNNVYCESVQDGASEKNDIAILRQKVTTTYPASKSGNSKTSSLFGGDKFEKGQSYTGKPRAAIIKVPTGTTVDQVNAQLESLETTPRLYRILSSNVQDVMTTEQLAMVENGQSGLTIADYEERRMIKNGETDEVILDPIGNVQYGSTYFSDTIVEDEDHRVLVQTRAVIAEEKATTTTENFLAEAAAENESVASQM